MWLTYRCFRFRESVGKRDSHGYRMALIRVDPLFDSVRHGSRYAALLTSMHQ